MPRNLSDDQFLQRLAAETDPAEKVVAPSRLKSRIYSALVQRQAETGPLQSLCDTKAAGRGLCVFEELVGIAPIGDAAKRLNPCRVCHARVLAEYFEDPPIYWPNCPYVSFKKS
ncbi:MAG: hypothetical protein ACRD3B_04970 [Candidatus Sulfotelmatobacter sp.]